MRDKKNSLLSIALGLWLISISLTFGNFSHPVGISDLICGVLLALFGLYSLTPNRIWPGWAIGLIGVWLQFAPLAFWAPQPLMYINDTLVGLLAIILSFSLAAKEEVELGSGRPRGWSFNPSGWSHRLPTVTLAMLCWFFSRYMAAFQLGYIDHIYDPFFPEGTLHVITSNVSKSFPISDAGLGAFAYSLEFLLGWQGGSKRWFRMPWLVFAFAFLVIPVGVVSIILIIMQPVLVGAWCFWCLATAACMLLMIILTAGELAAILQLFAEVRQRGGSLWQAFWKGAVPEQDRTPALPRGRPFEKISLGVTLPWNLLLCVALGAWVMFSPFVLGLTGSLAIDNYIQGPMILSCSVIALAEAFRSIRYLNLLLGLALIIAPWVSPGAGAAGSVNNVIIGLAIILLSFRKGTISERYGAWEALIK